MKRKVTKGVLGALALLVAAFGRTCLASPLPPPAPFAGPLPDASPPPEMAIYAISTGVIHRSAGFGYRGGSLLDKRDFAASAVLVKHPRGDVLIDTGFGKTIDKQFALLPAPFRAITSYTHTRSAAEQLDAKGYDRASLRGILLTHAHWDHVSGVPDFQTTPVLVTREERRFIDEGGVVVAVAKSNASVRYEEYDFEGGPYLGYDRSHDLYGDGALVIVPAPGHTPGSVIVFLTLPNGKRFAMLGDLVWQLEGITEREERPWVMRVGVDSDPEAVRRGILHVAAIHARYPEITLVPSHDTRGFAAMPPLF